MPGYKERINYLTADVSYVYWEGFYTGGLFAGVGGYSFKPQPVAFVQSPRFDWAEAGIGAAGGFTVALLLGGAILERGWRSRQRPAGDFAAGVGGEFQKDQGFGSGVEQPDPLSPERRQRRT